MKGNAARKVTSIVILVAVSLILFAMGFYSFAWFADIKNSGRFGFKAGTMADNVLEIAKVVHKDGDFAESITESNRQYYPCSDLQIEAGSLPEASGEFYSIALNKMSFGLIDSIAFLKPDNVVYFRLTVPKKNGNTVKLKFEYNLEENAVVEIYRNDYDEEGNLIQKKVTDEDKYDGKPIVDAFLEAESDGATKDCFIKYSVCVSNHKYEASMLSGLEFYGMDGQIANEDSDTHYRFNGSDIVTLKNDKIDEAEDFYYVYIMVEPNLDVIGRSIEYISSIMPCYTYFKVKAYFEIYEGDKQ